MLIYITHPNPRMIMYADRINSLPLIYSPLSTKQKAEVIKKGRWCHKSGNRPTWLPTPSHLGWWRIKNPLDNSARQSTSYEGMLSFRKGSSWLVQENDKVNLNPEDEVLHAYRSKGRIAHTPLAFLIRGCVFGPGSGYPVYNIGLYLQGQTIQMPLLAKKSSFRPWCNTFGYSQKGKAHVTQYPNNPTSATASIQFFEEVVDFANENDIISSTMMLILDDLRTLQAPSFLNATEQKSGDRDAFPLKNIKYDRLATWFCSGNANTGGSGKGKNDMMDSGLLKPYRKRALQR